jgi:hypothetical protein
MYELGTSAGAIRRLRLEIVSVEILQHLLVVKYFCCYIGMRDYRCRLILNGIKTFVDKIPLILVENKTSFLF